MAFASKHRISSSSRLLHHDALIQERQPETDEGISSGSELYDSEAEKADLYGNDFLESDTDDSDDDSCKDCYEDSSDSEDDFNSSLVEENGASKMRFYNTDALCQSLKYIISMPELCDVKFLVGPQKIPVCGVKAILGTRSRKMYSIILKRERELTAFENSNIKGLLGFRRNKKSKQSKRGKLIIPIENYSANIFRKIVQFIHSGSIDMDLFSIIDLYRGAEEFAIDDLQQACSEYIEMCASSDSSAKFLMAECECAGLKWLSNKIRCLIAKESSSCNKPNKSRQDTIVETSV